MALSKPQSSSGCDRTRFLRFALVVVDELTPVLRDVLEKEIPHPLLNQKVLSSKKLFERLQKQSDQLRLIQNASNDGYKDFDITLLCSLICNLCSKNISPTNGWWNSKMPSQGETKLGDDIERIRLIKNKLYSHIPAASISEIKFNKYWGIIHSVCQRIGNCLNKDYIKSLKKAEKCSFDEESEKKLMMQLINLSERDNEMRDEITEIAKSVRRIEEGLFSATTKVTVHEKDPAKKELSDVLLKTTVNLLNDIVDCINEVTTEEELEKVYESVEEFLKNESNEKARVFIAPLFDKLSSKIRNYANLKVRRICILAKYFKFVMKLRTEYDADIKVSHSSLLLKLKFSSEEGYVRYDKDLERGKIEEEILDLLLFPTYIACFDLKAEDLTVSLNDKTIKLHRTEITRAQVAVDKTHKKDRQYSETSDNDRGTENSSASSEQSSCPISSNRGATAPDVEKSTPAHVPIVPDFISRSIGKPSTTDDVRNRENCDIHSDSGYVRTSSSEYSNTSESSKSSEQSSILDNSREVHCSIPKEDKYKCSITCMTALEDGELVVYDGGNFKLKTFDSSGYYIGSIENIYNCRDIAAVHDKRFAITQEDKECMTIFLMHGIPKKPRGKQIPLPGKGYHCKYGRRHYAVTCDVSDDKSRCLTIMDANERRVLCMKIPNIYVVQMEINPHYDVVYLTDAQNKRITCLNFRGEEEWSQSLDWTPYSPCVVAENVLFVSSTDKQTVFKFPFQRRHWEELTDFECTRLLCYNARKSIMYVTIQKSDTKIVNTVHVLKKKLIMKYL